MADRRFRVDLAPSARRQLSKFSADGQRRIITALRGLESQPRPQGVERLVGMRGTPQWRIRVGDFRVIYAIHDDQLLVLVIRIGHRGKVYRMR